MQNKLKNFFKGKSILITGGTGSFGKEITSYFAKHHKNLSRLVIFSRDELKQFEMQNDKKFNHPNIRFFIGDVRDLSRLKRAMVGVDIIIHAAALKQVATAEYNPFECIQTNIIGAQNIIEASLESNVKKVIALSTDKATSPINLYGATKLCSDKLFISANNIKGRNDITFSVVRYGNVAGSRGSVIPLFLEQIRKKQNISLTDKRMTRFNITLKDSIEMVLWSIKNTVGGEILIPKIPSIKIIDLAEVIAKNSKIKIIGARQGEKIHEELITKSDNQDVYDIGKYYIHIAKNRLSKLRKKHPKIKKMSTNFTYSSDTNLNYLNKDQIKKLLKDF